jgi:ParB family transcriptional regulator, chromosome partitioning protein
VKAKSGGVHAFACGSYMSYSDFFLFPFSFLIGSLCLMSKSALGRGLGALLGGPLTPPAPAPSPIQPTPAAAPAVVDSRERVQKVPLDKVRPSALQPRKQFSDESLRELADSIREQGIVQPLIVRPRGDTFELIAGERRWRAAQLLKLPDVPVIARDADDRTVLELALIENLQRENLNPIEEALGYSQLSNQFELTQEEISAKVGKSRAAVANALRLLKLAQPIQEFIRQGQLSIGHAKVILGLADEKSQTAAAQRVVQESLNVRQTEGLISKLLLRREKEPVTRTTVAPPAGDPHLTDLEGQLREMFATKVKLNYAQGKGSLEISFFSDAELERILQVLGISRS